LADPIYQAISAKVSQGDILEVAPHVFLDPPLSKLHSDEDQLVYRIAPIGIPEVDEEVAVLAGCIRTLAIVVSYDCEIDRAAVKRWIICPIVPLSKAGDPGKQGHTKRNRVSSHFFLPRFEAVFPDSFVVLNQIATVGRDFITGSNRIVTLSDRGRLGLYAQFIRWLTRWEFRDVKCPACNAEFDPTLGMRVRPPE
jgi:hypothetical protein